MIKEYHSWVVEKSSPRTANARLLALKMLLKIALRDNATTVNVAQKVNFYGAHV
jgi:hypothetical protein